MISLACNHIIPSNEFKLQVNVADCPSTTAWIRGVRKLASSLSSKVKLYLVYYYIVTAGVVVSQLRKF